MVLIGETEPNCRLEGKIKVEKEKVEARVATIYRAKYKRNETVLELPLTVTTTVGQELHWGPSRPSQVIHRAYNHFEEQRSENKLLHLSIISALIERCSWWTGGLEEGETRTTYGEGGEGGSEKAS